MTPASFFHTCATVAVFVGVPANLLVLGYFLIGYEVLHQTTRILYLSISVTDLLIALSLIPMLMEHLGSFRLNNPPKNELLCDIIDLSLDTLLRLSYLLICLLAVLKARSICSPLSRERLTLFKRFLFGAIVFFLAQSSIPLAVRHLNKDQYACNASTKSTFTNPTVRKLWRISTVLVQVSLAMLVMVAANTVSIYSLLKHRGTKMDNLKAKAARTTFLLTMVYFCLHISGVVVSTCSVLGVTTHINGTYANGVACLSCAVDPLVYFLRLPGVWRFYGKVFNKPWMWIRGRFCGNGNSDQWTRNEETLADRTMDSHL